jgi:hypothetical protein
MKALATRENSSIGRSCQRLSRWLNHSRWHDRATQRLDYAAEVAHCALSVTRVPHAARLPLEVSHSGGSPWRPGLADGVSLIAEICADGAVWVVVAPPHDCGMESLVSSGKEGAPPHPRKLGTWRSEAVQSHSTPGTTRMLSPRLACTASHLAFYH